MLFQIWELPWKEILKYLITSGSAKIKTLFLTRGKHSFCFEFIGHIDPWPIKGGHFGKKKKKKLLYKNESKILQSGFSNSLRAVKDDILYKIMAWFSNSSEHGTPVRLPFIQLLQNWALQVLQNSYDFWMLGGWKGANEYSIS